MSAFALRKKLLAQQSQAVSAPLSETTLAETAISVNPDERALSPQKKARKTRSAQHASLQGTETAEVANEQSPNQDLNKLPESRQSEDDEQPRSPSLISPNDDEGERPEIHETLQPVNLSSFRSSKSNFRKKGNGVCQLKLDEGERLVILGSYGVQVESGEVTINGAILKASKTIAWVHAPQSHALPVIRCTEEASLELQPHPEAENLKALGVLSPMFRKLWCENPNNPSKTNQPDPSETFRILYTLDDVPKRAVLQDLRSPPEWNREMAALVASNESIPSIMITGPKSSGKSTFGKILTNRFLTGAQPRAKKPGKGGVVILDLDPGQSEYCGVGQLALVLITKPVLSPSFCRPLGTPSIRTIRSHALASLSPASDPELYTEMALDLVTHYRNTLAPYPLIINTPGWIQGTGLDLLVSLIRDLRPSEVFYLSQTGPADAVEALGGACHVARFSTLPSQPNQNNLRTAIHLRSMQTMAYFHAEVASPRNDEGHLCWFQRPLTAMTPWQVHFRRAGGGIFGVLCYDFQTQPDLLADTINGGILAVVEVESPKAFRCIDDHAPLRKDSLSGDYSESAMDMDISQDDEIKSSPFSSLQQRITTLTAEGIPFIDSSLGVTLDPRYSRSLGLTLVRGIDVENGNLHLLCPIAMEQVEDVRRRGGAIVLISGKFDPPSWAYTEDLYFQSEGDEVGGMEEVESHGQSEVMELGVGRTKLGKPTTSDISVESVPWIQAVTRNQKRGAGSKVWRVRRDLGRVGNSSG
ncbi:hypothetical protein F5B22DRAFT_636260 [Xylaria bambusicola]|uniref:uncharacterized protein n=1 Tax=Xylaria bambusicola TaxID=326684 RepID=UPI0020084C3E|nr:uncharacterized protein F5B22DRAFT_636260 [Xylaria bambusicola]KAI0517064.1 hypothetical protein F5B22DRAFT_636260 [Xylaria bambusicola]